LTNLAAVVLAAGDLAQAQDYHSRALSIRQRLAPDSADVAASLSGLGIVAQRRGDLAGAQGYYARALAIQERVAPRSMTMAFLLGNMGTLAYDSDELAIAQDYHARALAIYDALAPDSLELATALNNLGLVAWRRGDLAAAEAYHRRALTIKEKLAPDSMTVAASLTNLGIVASARSDLAAAYDYQSRALAIREKLAPGSLDVAANLNNLGNVARNRGDLAASEAYHGRALAIREKLAPESLSVATSLNNLGETARRRGNLAAAHDFHVRALAINELRAPGSLSVAVSLTGLGTIAGSRGESEAARQYHRRALTIRERLAPASLETASSLNSLAGLALKAQQYSEALPLLNRASDIVEAQRWQIGSTDARALLLAQYAETYSGLRRCHLALGDVPAAFAVTERARARSLLESLAEARAGIRPSVDPQLLERERSIQQALNDATARQTRLLGGPLDENKAAEAGRAVDALLVQYRQVQAEIRLKNPRYAALTQPQPLGLREIQQQVLDANSLLLEYSLGDEVSHLFAVTASTIRSFELPPRKDIERAARRVYELMTARQPVPGEALKTRQSRIAAADAGYPAAAAALSGMVLGPVVAELSTRRLLVVADGALQYVPFGALPAPGAATGHDPPLIVNHEIVNLPSASVIAVMRSEPGDRQAPARVVAVLADPVFDAADPRLKGSASAGAAPTAARTIPADVEQRIRTAGLIDERGSLSRLPFTRDEADAIVALAPSGQSTLAIDFRASRATVTSPELSQYRVVHLATHGLLDAERPELSGIVLSLVDERGAPQDGLLRLHEIYNLNWSADLVVLSACQTALGKEIKGEGLVGLTRGFMYGGARSVIASVWSVNDRATAELMKQFYRGLLVEGLSPPAALRTAQLDMLKRRPTRSPYYWAAFVVQGEWK
jgi:CHAT domain-containing protein/Tfp pilus assembly protein PilF